MTTMQYEDDNYITDMINSTACISKLYNMEMITMQRGDEYTV